MNNRINQQSGLDAIDKLKKAGAPCRFIYLTSTMRPSELQQALALGIEGLVLKEALPEELIHAVKMIHRGRKYYDVELLESRLTHKRQENTHKLTPKEMEVLQMLSERAVQQGDCSQARRHGLHRQEACQSDPVQAGLDGQNQSGSVLSSATGHVRGHRLIMSKALKRSSSSRGIAPRPRSFPPAPSEGRQPSPEAVLIQPCIHSAPHTPPHAVPRAARERCSADAPHRPLSDPSASLPLLMPCFASQGFRLAV